MKHSEYRKWFLSELNKLEIKDGFPIGFDGSLVEYITNREWRLIDITLKNATRIDYKEGTIFLRAGADLREIYSQIMSRKVEPDVWPGNRRTRRQYGVQELSLKDGLASGIVTFTPNEIG